MTSPRTIHLISLGCPKNRVDSEVMLGVAMRQGFEHSSDPSKADVIVVNTCGFIDPAKKESIDTILEMADYKDSGRCKQLVVAGCLSQRHPDEMAQELPEVDHFLGSSDMLRIGDVLGGKAERILVGAPADWLVTAASPRTLSTHRCSAYVKIAEGCNRSCSFCVIPELRGKQRSRSIEDVVREVEQLCSEGVREINLISQDTISYGRDLSPRANLASLVEAVAGVADLRWLRLFYLYPEQLDDHLIELLGDHPKVLPYVDMPLQHASDSMLMRMRRGHGGQRLRRLVTRLKDRIQNLTFRTAFIVGHPGETEADFDELCEFVTFASFDRVGVFLYSDEASAHSHSLADKVPDEVAQQRAEKLTAMTRRIARERTALLVGQKLEVLVEGESDEHEMVLMGRHAGQAPEIDGQVYLSGTEMLPKPPKPGQFVVAEMSQSSDYDLVGEVLSLADNQGVQNDATAGKRRVSLRLLTTDNRKLPS